ncbi:MAG: ATP-binding protein [Lachnospiraceae bacterium]|nr:ATP-binding protein [Lachnospiraceae bacterium]
MNNPFNISFGQIPNRYINRLTQSSQIVDTFQSENPSTNAYILTGVRGCGKTVMMTSISETIAKDESWMVVELNPEIDMLHSLAAALYSDITVRDRMVKSKIDLSVLGLGVSVENGVSIIDMDIAIRHMLENIAQLGRKLLVTVDEVTNNPNIKAFAASYQIYIRKNYPIYLLMTGLYENINSLQNDKSLTFLYRAPKLLLEPLNFTAVKTSYKKVFDTDDSIAEDMARLTRGYSFAFQVLGYLVWEKGVSALQEILPEYDQYLAEYVYDKIWSELSAKDKEIICEMASSHKTRVADIREGIGFSTSEFSVYRDRLMKKGILSSDQYGHVNLALPRFEEFVTEKNRSGYY